MDFAFTPEQEAWRREIQDFLKDNPPEKFPIQSGEDSWGHGAFSYEFVRLLGSKGWIALTWPAKYGGSERSNTDLMILFEELAWARVPWAAGAICWSMANSILDMGSEELKQEFLPGIGKGETMLWLAMSEPDAGSDLLALRTTAVEQDDCFLVNGQKVWSSLAHLSQYGFLFVRTATDPNTPKWASISTLLLDKSLPGVTVQPMVSMLGDIFHTEVFLDNVRVPKKHLLGEKDQAVLHLAKTLEFDRFWARFPKARFCQRITHDLVQYAKETRVDGELLSQQPAVRAKLVDSAIEIEACRQVFWNIGWKLDKGVSLTYEASAAKVLADDMGLRFFDRGMQILGLYAYAPEADKWAKLKENMRRWYLWTSGDSLAGGTSEIARNTMATAGLRLPRK
jgi:alkylation response protein AidB-like acyl-CoA dehydrogenase